MRENQFWPGAGQLAYLVPATKTLINSTMFLENDKVARALCLQSYSYKSQCQNAVHALWAWQLLR